MTSALAPTNWSVSAAVAARATDILPGSIAGHQLQLRTALVCDVEPVVGHKPQQGLLDLPTCRGVRASALSPVSHSGGVTLPRATRKASGFVPILLPRAEAARHKFLRLGVSRHLGAVSASERVPALRCRNARAHTGDVNSALAPVIHLFALSKLTSWHPHHGRSEKGWRYQIPVMRCPK